MKITSKSKVVAETEVKATDRSSAINKLQEAIDELVKLENDPVAKDAVANISVILFDLQDNE